MAVRKLPKEVLKMASGLILLSGLAGHRRPLCNEGLLAPARGQCQVSSWPLSGHSSSDSGSSKPIKEQMIPLRSLQGQQIQALTINIQVICVVYFSN